jgi:hypothetical protein
MPTINLNVILAAVGYAALTGLFNLLLGHKSQVEAWALANPRLAAILKLTRALGLDPWNIFSAALLLLKGKLPAAQQANSPIAKAEQQKLNVARLAGPLIVLLFCCSLPALHGCATAKPPCDEAKLRAVDAAYLTDLAKACLQYPTAQDCPSYPGLKAKHEADLKASCPE